jgi:hypothetical protein
VIIAAKYPFHNISQTVTVSFLKAGGRLIVLLPTKSYLYNETKNLSRTGKEISRAVKRIPGIFGRQAGAESNRRITN